MWEGKVCGYVGIPLDPPLLWFDNTFKQESCSCNMHVFLYNSAVLYMIPVAIFVWGMVCSCLVFAKRVHGKFPSFPGRSRRLERCWDEKPARRQHPTPHQRDTWIHPQVKGTISLQQLINKSKINQPVNTPHQTDTWIHPQVITINVPVVYMGRYEVVLRGDYP